MVAGGTQERMSCFFSALGNPLTLGAVVTVASASASTFAISLAFPFAFSFALTLVLGHLEQRV